MKHTIIVLSLLAFFSLLPSDAFSFQLGLHMDLTYDGYQIRRAAAIEKAKSINSRVSRNSFLWHQIEPTKGNLDWARTDSVVDELLAAGIEPLFCIYGSPSWANGVSTSTPDYYLYVPTEEAAFQRWLEEYRVFVKTATGRYKGKVKKWELWNEENEHYFWKPKPNLDQFARWFQAIQGEIKSIDPTAQIALGGLAGLCCSGPDDYNGKYFLTRLYQQSIFPDIVAIHPYSNGAPDIHVQWENNFDDIALIRKVMADYGQTGKKVWVTEWGWSTDKIAPQNQAEWLRISLDLIRKQYPFISLATFFIDYDRPPEYYHGLFTFDFQPKPAASVFKEFSGSLKSLSPPKNFRLSSR